MIPLPGKAKGLDFKETEGIQAE